MSPAITMISTLQPLLFVSRITGFYLFTFDSKYLRTCITKLDKICIVLTIILNTAINFGFLLSNYDPGVHALAMMKYSLPILMYVNHLIDIFGMIWIFVKRNKILKIITNLSEIDEELIKIGAKIDHEGNQKSLKNLMILLLCCGLTMSVWCGTVHGLNEYDIDVLFQFFSLWIFLCSLVIYFHFFIGIFAISQRFHILCEIFHEILPKNLRKLQSICEIYLQIAEIIFCFKKIYGPLLTLYFGNAFCWLCLSIFSLAMITKLQITHICTIFCALLHSCITIIACFFVVKAAERMNCEKEILMRSSYKKMNEFDGNFGFCVKISQLQTQINDVNMKFSCLFFDINWNFVFKFFSAGVMYFIILVQFEKSLTK
ncbi:hypothetical protein PVAND_016974 [Polypedilum vanderplanki]|uniref:Gustatory receptor n=1 Tax=Polypedilum vanderplanki TaxID=319348 RepID=A0A9J6BHS2_POLVA|nr:hypothetical protein PVAND_016974 [Polypedilum vanderplanki]